MVGHPIITGYPDAAACIANRSASIFERVYGPGMSSGSNQRWRGTEQNGFGRAVQETLYAALARRLDDDLGATEIDGVKIGLPRHPHPRQPGQVIDLVD